MIKNLSLGSGYSFIAFILLEDRNIHAKDKHTLPTQHNRAALPTAHFIHANTLCTYWWEKPFYHQLWHQRMKDDIATICVTKNEWQFYHGLALKSSSVWEKITINFTVSGQPVEWFLISNRTKPKMQLEQLVYLYLFLSISSPNYKFKGKGKFRFIFLGKKNLTTLFSKWKIINSVPLPPEYQILLANRIHNMNARKSRGNTYSAITLQSQQV